MYKSKNKETQTYPGLCELIFMIYIDKDDFAWTKNHNYSAEYSFGHLKKLYTFFFLGKQQD